MKPAPKSFWIAWHECRLTVIEITSCGEYFWALGQEEAWALQHADLIKEIDIEEALYELPVKRLTEMANSAGLLENFKK